MVSVLAEGSLTMDGTEQNLLLYEPATATYVGGYIDLSPMATGDVVEIRLYAVIKSGGAYVLWHVDTYEGVQTEPLLMIPFKPLYYGIKITIKQVAGTYKTFDYQFFEG